MMLDWTHGIKLEIRKIDFKCFPKLNLHISTTTIIIMTVAITITIIIINTIITTITIAIIIAIITITIAIIIVIITTIIIMSSSLCARTMS